MGERVSSEDPSIRTFRARIERSGGTKRPRLRLPPEATEFVPSGVVRLDLGGTVYHADVREHDDGLLVVGAFDNARLARSPGEGVNRLPVWLDDVGLAIGRSVLFDVVVPDALYGARPPGRTTVYDVIEPPRSSLSDIAASLEE